GRARHQCVCPVQTSPLSLCHPIGRNERGLPQSLAPAPGIRLLLVGFLRILFDRGGNVAVRATVLLRRRTITAKALAHTRDVVVVQNDTDEQTQQPARPPAVQECEETLKRAGFTPLPGEKQAVDPKHRSEQERFGPPAKSGPQRAPKQLPSIVRRNNDTNDRLHRPSSQPHKRPMASAMRRAAPGGPMRSRPAAAMRSRRAGSDKMARTSAATASGEGGATTRASPSSSRWARK